MQIEPVEQLAPIDSKPSKIPARESVNAVKQNPLIYHAIVVVFVLVISFLLFSISQANLSGLEQKVKDQKEQIAGLQDTVLSQASDINSFLGSLADKENRLGALKLQVEEKDLNLFMKISDLNRQFEWLKDKNAFR
jgi:cell shape-determining protein MreC